MSYSEHKRVFFIAFLAPDRGFSIERGPLLPLPPINSSQQGRVSWRLSTTIAKECSLEEGGKLRGGKKTNTELTWRPPYSLSNTLWSVQTWWSGSDFFGGLQPTLSASHLLSATGNDSNASSRPPCFSGLFFLLLGGGGFLFLPALASCFNVFLNIYIYIQKQLTSLPIIGGWLHAALYVDLDLSIWEIGARPWPQMDIALIQQNPLGSWNFSGLSWGEEKQQQLMSFFHLPPACCTPSSLARQPQFIQLDNRLKF